MALGRIRAPAVIDKSDIAVCRSLQGCINATPLMLLDVLHAPGALAFCEFCGSIDMADLRYHGAHHFEMSTGQTRTFDSIPGLGDESAVPPESPAPPKSVWDVPDSAEAEVDNGI